MEGWKSISSVLSQNDIIIESVFTSRAIPLSKSAQIPQIIEVTPSDLKKLSHLQSPTDAVAIVQLADSQSTEIMHGERIIYLDDIQDPGNLGTIMRIADWYGFSKVWRSPGSADFYGPKVIQSSMGSFVNLELATLDNTALLEIKDLQLIVTALHGRSSLDTLSSSQSICLVIGNEGKGVSQILLEQATLTYTISGSSSRKAESLNAAIAAGIMCEKIFGLTTTG